MRWSRAFVTVGVCTVLALSALAPVWGERESGLGVFADLLGGVALAIVVIAFAAVGIDEFRRSWNG